MEAFDYYWRTLVSYEIARGDTQFQNPDGDFYLYSSKGNEPSRNIRMALISSGISIDGSLPVNCRLNCEKIVVTPELQEKAQQMYDELLESPLAVPVTVSLRVSSGARAKLTKKSRS